MTQLFDGANIDLSEDYVLQDDFTLTTKDYYFNFTADSVTFDGNGKTITLDNIELYDGLFYNRSFSYTTIKNLNLDIRTDGLLGKETIEIRNGFMCKNYYGKDGMENKIENCNVTGANITNNSCGGIAGSNTYDITLTNCEVRGKLETYIFKEEGQAEIEISPSKSGGLVGDYGNNLKLRHCTFIGDIIGTESASGILAQYTSNCIIEDCIFEGNILRGEILVSGDAIAESLVDENGGSLDLSDKNVTFDLYTSVPITTVTGNGSGMKLNLHVDSNTIISSLETATMEASGYGYRVGDQLKIAAGELGASSEDIFFTLVPRSFSGSQSHNSRDSTGIVGNNGTDNIINRCTCKGNLVGFYTCGITGNYNKRTTISKCVFQGTTYTGRDGTVYPSGVITTDSSGICGTWGEDNVINDCTCNVTLIGNILAGAWNQGAGRASGILGLYNYKGRVYGCSANVETLMGDSGGIVAQSNKGVYVENCHFVGQRLYDQSGGIGGKNIDRHTETIDEETVVYTRSVFINCTTKCRSLHNRSGGILGESCKYTDVINCTVEIVDLEDSTAGNIGHGDNSSGSGGISGRSCSHLHVNNCYVKCNEVKGYTSGGIMGGYTSDSFVENSYVITKSGVTGQRSGGIYGGHGNDNAVSNSYIICDVKGSRSGGVFGAYSTFSRSTDNSNSLIGTDDVTIVNFANINQVYIVGEVQTTGSDGTLEDEGYVGARSSSGHVVANCTIDSSWSDSNSYTILSNVEVITNGSPPQEDTIYVSSADNEPYTLSWELFLSFAESDTIKNIVASSISLDSNYTFTGTTSDPNDFDIDFEVEIKLEGIQLSDMTSVQQDNLVVKLRQSYAAFYQRDESSIVITVSEGSIIVTVEIYKSSVPQEVPISVTSGLNLLGFSYDVKIKGSLVGSEDSIERVYECDGSKYTELIRGPDYYYTLTAGKGYAFITRSNADLTKRFYGESTSSVTLSLQNGWNYIGSSVENGKSDDTSLEFYSYNDALKHYMVEDNQSLGKDLGFIVYTSTAKQITISAA